MLEMADKLTGRSKDSNEAIAVAGDIVMSRGVLLGVGDEERAANVLHVEGREAARKPLVFEGLFAEVHALEVRVIDLDFGGAEIRDVEEAVPVDLGGSHAFVDPAVGSSSIGIVHLKNCIMEIDARVPARDRAIFGRKDENGLLTRSKEEVRRTAIENDPGGSRLSARRRTLGSGNGDHKWWDGVGLAIIESGGTGVVVADPPGASGLSGSSGGAGESPRIFQIGVDHGSFPRDVGDEVRLFVMLRLCYTGEQEKRTDK